MSDLDDGIDCVNGANTVHAISKVISVISDNMIIIALSDKFRSQLPAVRLVQQRLLQRLQRSELAGVEDGEALGFGFELHDREAFAPC